MRCMYICVCVNKHIYPHRHYLLIYTAFLGKAPLRTICSDGCQSSLNSDDVLAEISSVAINPSSYTSNLVAEWRIMTIDGFQVSI